MTTGRSLRLGEAVFGAGVLGLGLFIAGYTMLTTPQTNAVVGPALFPYLISGGLVLVGIALLWQAVSGHIAHETGFDLDLTAVALASGGLLAQVFLVEALGWILSVALLFAVVARAFGSRRLLLDLGIGLALGGLSFLVFNYGLDLYLPTGTLADRIADLSAPAATMPE